MAPYVQMLRLQVAPERRAAFEALMAEEAPRTRAFDGCERFEVYADDEGTVVFLEHWESEEKSRLYGQWRQARGDFETLRAFLTAPPFTSAWRWLSP